MYTHNVKKGATYLPFRKILTIEIENHTYQQKQGINVCVFCVMYSMFHFINKNTYEEQKIEVTYWCICGLFCILIPIHIELTSLLWFLKLQQIDFSKQYLTPQRILAVQEQLFGFINEEVIPLTGRHHVAKFAIGQESPPPPLHPRKWNPAKKNQRGSDSSANQK
jgi:hypothetical protein